MSYRIPSDGGFRAFFDAVPGRVVILILVAQVVVFLFFAAEATRRLDGAGLLLAYIVAFLPAIIVGVSLFIRGHARVGILLILSSIVTFLFAAAHPYFSVQGLYLFMAVFGVAISLAIYEAKLPQRFGAGFKRTLWVLVPATPLILVSHLLAPDEEVFSFYLVPELGGILLIWFFFALLDVVGLWKHLKRAWYYFPIAYIAILVIWSETNLNGEQLVLESAGAGFFCWVIASFSLAFLKRPTGDVVAGGIVALTLLGNLIDVANG